MLGKLKYKMGGTEELLNSAKAKSAKEKKEEEVNLDSIMQ